MKTLKRTIFISRIKNNFLKPIHLITAKPSDSPSSNNHPSAHRSQQFFPPLFFLLVQQRLSFDSFSFLWQSFIAPKRSKLKCIMQNDFNSSKKQHQPPNHQQHRLSQSKNTYKKEGYVNLMSD